MGVIRFESIPAVVQAIHMLYSGWAGPGLLATTDKETYWREIAALVEGRLFTHATDRTGKSDNGRR
jgi:hypothetical protein